MKIALTVVLFLLFTIGVIVDGYEVSVMEGDSVTLKSGVTKRQTDEGIEWRFSGTRIAKISSDSNEIWVKPDGSFEDRLKLDSQTGDLKISNIRTTDSGQYKVKISRSENTPPEMIFTVKVVSADEVKPVLEGDSVTLCTGLTDIKRDDVIQWRYGQQKSPVAEISGTAGIFNTYDGPDERFRDRLKLDHQTGSLTITNTRTTDSGDYEVEISRGRYTIHHTESFSVTVSDDVESVSVLKGDNVTLLTGLTETQTDDKIRWKFGDDAELFTRLNGPVNKKWINIDLNSSTRDLNIRNIQRDQSGDYKVEIITRRMILHRKYQITVIGALKSVSVKEGETVTLPITKLQKDDLIQWMFGETVIAEIHIAAQRFYISDVLDKSFRDRLKLDHQTGSLIITNTRTTDSGLYEVKIRSSRRTINRRITVTVTGLGRSDHDTGLGRSDHDTDPGLSPGLGRSDHDTDPGLSPGLGRSDHDTGLGRSDHDTDPGLSPAVPDAGLSPAAVAGIVVVVLLLLAAAVTGVIFYCHKMLGLEGKRAGEYEDGDPTFIPMLKKYPQAQPCKSDGSDPENI